MHEGHVRVAQVVDHLSRKYEALSSKFSTAKKPHNSNFAFPV
jgi:hypothetical protein